MIHIFPRIRRERDECVGGILFKNKDFLIGMDAEPEIGMLFCEKNRMIFNNYFLTISKKPK